MKHLNLIAALFLIQKIAFSQGEISFPHRYQIGVITTDIILPSASFEASYYIDEKHSVGLYSSFPGMYSDGDEYYSSISSGFSGGLFHRFVLLELPHRSNEFLYLKHGPRFTFASLNYSREDWFPVYENGNEYLIFEERKFEDNLSKFGYNLSVGLLHIIDHWYLEYYCGVKYERILNKDEIFHDTQENMFWVENRWLQEGFSPMVGIIIGFGWKP